MLTALPDRSSSLQPFFTPRGVAVIGASRDPSKLSYGVMRNLLDPEHGYPGPVYPVNPRAADILGLPCYPDISAVPDPIELAVLLVPAAMVPSTVGACGQRGLKAVVVISGGFREVGPEGAAREREMVEIARRYRMRVMGPNGIGVIDTHTPLNTTFVKGMPQRGHIAFMSQSGALCGGIIDWALARGLGFSRFLSVGNEADVNETDVIPFLAADDISRVITLYLEDVKGGPDFVAALREATQRKPVLVIKTGRTAGGQAATASHTGALAGVHAAFRAACRQAGVIEVESIRELFDGALALAYQPLPAGGRIAILTNAGGPAALAADALENAGLQLARTGLETRAALRGCLHAEAQVAGPVDMLGGADQRDYRRALDALLADPANDGVLAILVPQVLVDPVAVVDAIAAGIAAAAAASAPVDGSSAPRKPVLACLMGAASLDAAFATAHRAQIPAYPFPEDAVASFGILRRRAREIAKASERAKSASIAPTAGRQPDQASMAASQRLLSEAAAAGRSALDAAESQTVLNAFGLASPPDLLATSSAEAAEYSRRIGFPVVLKLASPDILHKTDVGGVILGVTDEAAARAGFDTILARARAAHPGARIRGVQVQRMIGGGQEVIVGVKRDPTFGPLIMFGLGGVYVEALADVSFRLAPLTTVDAEEMIAEVRSARLLAGLRGAPPADRPALVAAIVRIGDLAAACPMIAELDVNPLLVLPDGQGTLALDARIILAKVLLAQ
jgi:acetyl coenzyme A synthetase (ADP forming)-like protein